MLRSLMFYRQLNLAVMLGVAVASAVLTGALMVGDSVRNSLRNMALEKLGDITHVTISDHMMRANLATDLSSDPDLGEARAAGVVFMEGSATASEARASKVQITGIDASFIQLFNAWTPGSETLPAKLGRENNQIFPSAIVNQSFADELGVEVGAGIVLSFENFSDIHRDSLYGKKTSDDVVKKLRVQISAIIPDEGMGRFALTAGQGVARNVFVPIDNLRRVLETDGVNAVFIAAGETPEEEVKAAMARHATLEDLNIVARLTDDYFSIESPAYFLAPEVAEETFALAGEQNLLTLPLSAYLANRIIIDERMTPYSLIGAGNLTNRLIEATPVAGKATLGEDEILFSQWLADDLGASIGDTVEVQHYAVSADDSLTQDVAQFTLAGILPMTGAAVDQRFAPVLPGIEDAEDMNEWDPPFDMDMSLIRDKDEDFWDEYRTAPKIFVSHEAGKRMWDSRFGYYTGIRIGAAEGQSLEQTRDAFSAALLERIDPESAGLPLIPLRARGLEASKGSTDFSMLFISFSFFIIISAALLVGLFFRLSVEQRRAEVGILAAMGYRNRKIRRRFLGEGLIIAAVGAAIGIAGGFAYAVLIMRGLRTWWSLGSSRLFFHFEPASIVIGALSAMTVALLAIWITTRVVGKIPITVLVGGGNLEPARRGAKRARIVLVIALIGAIAMGAGSAAAPSAAGLFFGLGACLLVAGLALIAILFSERRVENGLGGMWRMASRNSARQGGRALVCVTLVASACFVITSVGLMRHSGMPDTSARDSGAGGYFLEAQSNIPLPRKLESLEAPAELGLDQELTTALQSGEVRSFRLQGGDDASCLNLFAPGQPRILGVPEPEKLEGRFKFVQRIKEGPEEPWSMLNMTFEDGAIPAIADLNSVMWILKSGLGQDIVIEDDRGQEVRLRLVALVNKSIFQSELIISEDRFLEIFPDQNGFRYFLFDSPEDIRESLAASLESSLADYGVDASRTGAKLAAFNEVENTYISIFQMLGGLGLLLGTIGLGAIIYRNTLERKGELAAMRAFGFRLRKISLLLLAENTVLILWGIMLGAVSAIIAVMPHLLDLHGTPPLTPLVLTLTGVFVVGLTASVFAVERTRRFPLLQALRGR